MINKVLGCVDSQSETPLNWSKHQVSQNPQNSWLHVSEAMTSKWLHLFYTVCD